MIDRCIIGTQADRHDNVVQQAIAAVNAVFKDITISLMPMRLLTAQGDLLVHL